MNQPITNPSATRRPRILLAMPQISERTGGGIARVGHSLLRLLAEKGRQHCIDFRVLALGEPCDAQEMQRLDLSTSGCGTWCGDSWLRFSLTALRWMATWADLAIFTHLGLGSLLGLLPRRLRPASMIFIHGIEVWGPLGLRKRRGLLCSDMLVSNTEFTARKAREAHAWFPPCRCCHLGIPSRVSSSAIDLERQLGFVPREHDIVIVGRLARGETYKGHRLLIPAMSKVVQAVPDARLLIVGTGNDTPLYHELVQRSPVADHIVFTGYIPDDVLWELYRRCGVFAMPSRQEGFGLVYVEAMQAGLPCVASNADAAQEVVVDGQTGFLVDRDDQSALEAALIRLLQDAELRGEMGRHGQQRAESLFTESKFHERFWTLVGELLPALCAELPES